MAIIMDDDSTFSINCDDGGDNCQDLYCKCDKEYSYDNSHKDLILEGEPELVRYMNNQDTDDFFNKINYNF